ncbi:hypothetical protein THAOC_24821 [Thalassiosira oceanica]|uniref:Hexosyltransferase n=1 Tax=Thalassiosira oceanica TaxID=159749 RepID=K0RNT8_THAOC|nr:hypothetical protein THAOC_24821 [Thalassiosira oceanica]|eukprot:EJK55448.1 hypothetical protein THAOC_24821 [Thalassiosira oceanica]
MGRPSQHAKRSYGLVGAGESDILRDMLKGILPVPWWKFILTAMICGYLPMILYFMNDSVSSRSKHENFANKPNHHEDHHKDHRTASCDPSNFLVMIKAGATRKYHTRREVWRNSTCPELYRNNSVRYRFMLGMPAYEMIDPASHNQHKRSNLDEIEDMGRMEKEASEYRDMEFLPLKDVYEDFYFKTLNMIKWAATIGMEDDTSMVVIHDDEYCFQPEILRGLCLDATSNNQSLYAGSYLWSEANYEAQNGTDGSFSPYFSGHLYALDSWLTRSIAHDPRSPFASKTKASAEDVVAGKWVEDQREKTDIRYAEEPSLMFEVNAEYYRTEDREPKKAPIDAFCEPIEKFSKCANEEINLDKGSPNHFIWKFQPIALCVKTSKFLSEGLPSASQGKPRACRGHSLLSIKKLFQTYVLGHLGHYVENKKYGMAVLPCEITAGTMHPILYRVYQVRGYIGNFLDLSPWLPLSLACYAMKVSWPPQSASLRPGRLSVQGVLPSEVAKNQAQISNLKVHQPQGQHDEWPEGGWLPLAFACYAMKVSCPPQCASQRPGRLAVQGVLPSEVAKN